MADPKSEDSNNRLANIFEMIVARLDTIESNQAALKAQLDQQNLAVMYNDSERPWGQTFSAVPWTGHCLDLSVFAHFDASGELIGAVSPGAIYVIGVDQSPSPRSDGYSALCDTFPGVLAVGQFSIAMTECRSIQAAVRAAVDMARHFNLDPPSLVNVHVITESLAQLAISIVRGYGETEAFEALPRECRENLQYGHHEFFAEHMSNGIPMRLATRDWPTMPTYACSVQSPRPASCGSRQTPQGSSPAACKRFGTVSLHQDVWHPPNGHSASPWT